MIKLFAFMIMLVSFNSNSSATPVYDGSFEFGGLIKSSSVNLPLFTDNEVTFDGNLLSNVNIGNIQGDFQGVFGGYDMLFSHNNRLPLQIGSYNESFMTFTGFNFATGLSTVDFLVTLLSINETYLPANSGVGLFGTVMLSGAGYENTQAKLSMEISEAGTYSASGRIYTSEVATVPVPPSLILMMAGLPYFFYQKRKNAVQTLAGN